MRDQTFQTIEECSAPTESQNVTLAEDTQDDAEIADDLLEEDEDHEEALVESGAETNSDHDTSVDDNDELLEKQTNVLEQVKIKVIDNLYNDEVRKSSKSMIRNFEKGVKGNVQTLITTLCCLTV